MKKGEIAEGVVEKLRFPDQGILQIEGKKAIVKHVIPGQRIRFRVKKNRADRIEGQLVEVVEKAPCELDVPACPHAVFCGGCTFQSLPYETQLELKGKMVSDLLGMPEAEVVIADAASPTVQGRPGEVLPVYASPQAAGYRNKMEFTFGDAYKGGPLTLGQHKRGGFFDIIDVPDCRIADADFGAILSATRDFFAERGVPYYHRMRHEGILRHLLVRKASKTGEILVDLIAASGMQDLTEADGTPMPAAYAAMLQALPLRGTLTGVLYTKNDSAADAVRDEGTVVLYGREYFTEELLGLSFRITPFSFFQTNSGGAEVLYTQVRRMIGALENDPVVFDLYSGTGTIAQMVAPAAGKVIGVEIVPEAVEAARENAALNGLENCEFLCGDVLEVLDVIPEKPDFIILDPPRDGIHPKALAKIIAYGVPQMVYISCKPTSLVRDLEILRKGGYEVQDICCVDMFPATNHVETVCLLGNRKYKPDAYVDLSLDMEDYYRIIDSKNRRSMMYENCRAEK